MKRYGRLDENLQGTLQKNRVFCAVMPIHDQRISRRTETRRLFELTKLKKAPSFVIVGLFSADHYLVPCLSLLSSECVVFTDVPRDFQRLAEYFSDGWRREGVIDSSCLFKIGAEVRTVRWKISNNTHPVPVLNNTHPFPSKCSVDALCRVRESVRFASERFGSSILLGSTKNGNRRGKNHGDFSFDHRNTTDRFWFDHLRALLFGRSTLSCLLSRKI